MQINDFTFEVDLEADTLAVASADGQYVVHVGREGNTVSVSIIDRDGTHLAGCTADLHRLAPHYSDYGVWVLRDSDGEFLGRTQAASRDHAILKWERIYGERAASAETE